MPTEIVSISVTNVRGISNRKHVFENPDMLGNKFHILFAPNGYGKSSIASAFDSLKPRSLKLPADLLHMGNEANMPEITIVYKADGVEQTLKANETCNEISKSFSIFVINSKLKPKAVAKTGFDKFAKPKASLIIEPIILKENIPVRPGKNITTPNLKHEFGDAGKILPSIEPYLRIELLVGRVLNLPGIKKFRQKSIWKEIDKIIQAISEQNVTREELQLWIENNKLAEFEAIPELSSLANLFDLFNTLTRVDKFCLAIQFARAYQTDITELKAHFAWHAYQTQKKRCADLLAEVNSNPEWINVSVKQTKGELIAEFPAAAKMSNGQRDLLVFIAQLMKAEFELTSNRAILLVDEVFDYLDESNLIVAQFYVTRFVERFKSDGAEIFPLFLTHLNPDVFRHSILGLGTKELRKVHFLDKASHSDRTLGIALMVRKREEATLKPFIGKYFFHYHPDDCNQVAIFKANSIKETWGQSHRFYKYVFDEFKEYISGDETCDFVAACVAARIAIEKSAYDLLSEPNKIRFLDEFKKGTVEKLNFVEELGLDVPDSHRILGLLYNDMLHHKDQYDYISAIVSKMKNPAILGLMKSLTIPTTF